MISPASGRWRSTLAKLPLPGYLAPPEDRAHFRDIKLRAVGDSEVPEGSRPREADEFHWRVTLPDRLQPVLVSTPNRVKIGDLVHTDDGTPICVDSSPEQTPRRGHTTDLKGHFLRRR